MHIHFCTQPYWFDNTKWTTCFSSYSHCNLPHIRKPNENLECDSFRFVEPKTQPTLCIPGIDWAALSYKDCCGYTNTRRSMGQFCPTTWCARSLTTEETTDSLSSQVQRNSPEHFLHVSSIRDQEKYTATLARQQEMNHILNLVFGWGWDFRVRVF